MFIPCLGLAQSNTNDLVGTSNIYTFKQHLNGVEYGFYKQPNQKAGTLDIYVASICNRTEEQMDVYGMDVWKMAAAQGIKPANNVTLLAELNKAKKTSWQRKTLTVLEILSYGVTVATTTNVIKINTNTATGKAIVAAIPTVGTLIRTGTTLVKNDYDETYAITTFNLVPSLFRVAGESCVVYDLPGSN